MKHYHATECIFDLLAASGPQELREIRRECLTQCTEPAFASDEGNLSTEHHNAVNGALHTLVKAGLIDMTVEEEGPNTYDLTDYGYTVLSLYGEREREFEAHKREVADHWADLEQSWTRPPGGMHECD